MGENNDLLTLLMMKIPPYQTLDQHATIGSLSYAYLGMIEFTMSSRTCTLSDAKYNPN